MWNYVNVSVKGVSHEDKHQPCQDDNSCIIVEDENQSILVVVVADGAGSAAKAEIGSAFVCRKFAADIEKQLRDNMAITGFDNNFFKKWIADFQNELQSQIESEDLRLRDFACTFLAAIISDEAACFAQIGDGAIVVKDEENQYSFVFMPQQGEYVNQTFFATDKNAANQLEFVFLERHVIELALFTDGIQNLVIDSRQHTVNDDFFSQWFEWLHHVEDQNIGNASLENYLNSPAINERTDDDKTLVLAVRTNC